MENDPTDHLYLLLHGMVKIMKITRDGKEVILEIKVPGEMFCCAAVLDNRPYPETAQAIGNVSIMRISRRDLLKVIDEHPSLQMEFARYANEQLKEAHEMFMHIASETVENRIAAILLRLSEKTGIENADYIKIDMPLTKQDIADMIGSSAETCMRTLSRFQKDGLIKSSYRTMYIKPDRIRKFLASNDVY